MKDVGSVLDAGADKVSINSAAVQNPALIGTLAKAFGAQCIVVAIDARNVGGQWLVHTHGGKHATDKSLFTWAKEAEDRGAGEILFTSMDHDGTKKGFAINELLQLHEILTIPVIASGGAGTITHFEEVFLKAKADAALAASIFHFGEVKIPELKSRLSGLSIPIRS